jgi:hypothetical protein
MYFTASEHNTGGHFYVKVGCRLKESLEKSENLTSETEREKYDENGSGERIRG